MQEGAAECKGAESAIVGRAVVGVQVAGRFALSRTMPDASARVHCADVASASPPRPVWAGGACWWQGIALAVNQCSKSCASGRPLSSQIRYAASWISESDGPRGVASFMGESWGRFSLMRMGKRWAHGWRSCVMSARSSGRQNGQHDFLWSQERQHHRASEDQHDDTE